MKPGILTAVAILTLLAPPGAAAVVNGRIVDANGVGIANVDLDVDNEGSGGDPTVSGDFTDANGFFSMTVTPGGVYTLIIKPSTPPIQHMPMMMQDVSMVGTVNMGTIAMSPAVPLDGRVLSGITGLPVAGVNIDVFEVATGNELFVPMDNTNALGQFSIAVPLGDLEVRFKTASLVGQTLVPWSANVVVTGPTNMGDLTLEQGYLISALCKTTVGNLPIKDVNLDVIDAVTGEELFTPGDNSDGTGLLDVVLPAGTFDFEFCPQFQDLLVAEERLGQVVGGPAFLGTIFFDPGVVLSGTVQGSGVGPLAGVDIDVRHTTTGQGVLLCGDNTSGSGGYAVVVPTGTFDVSFTPPTGSPFGPLTIGGVLVSGNKTLNATLSPCGALTSYCTAGTSASGCVPSISAIGTPSATAPSGFDLTVSGVEGAKNGLFFYGTNGRQAAPWGSGTSFQCVVPPVKRGALISGGGTSGACNGAFSYDLNARWAAKPNHNPGSGALVQAQLWFRDPLNTSNQSTSLSDALEFSVCP